jgi:hypothetical protein
LETLLLLKTPRVNRVHTPFDTGKTGWRRGNQSMEKVEVEAARFLGRQLSILFTYFVLIIE